jgi:release factor glutamine methyltransferase
VNIKEALAHATVSLESARVPEPRREARTLLALATDRDSVFFIAHPEHELSQAESMKFEELVRRRGNREPYHLIRGSREFFNMEFSVRPGVLIPRPETELLVEHAINLLSVQERPHLFEIGVGTGCISISILKNVAGATATGIDISQEACDLAAKNAQFHGVLSRLRLEKADLFEGKFEVYDMVVSNPPYIPIGDRPTLEPEVSRYDPATALYGGEDGLDVVRRILTASPDHIRANGHLLLEIGVDQFDVLEKLFDPAIWADLECWKDLQGIPRVVCARKLPNV